MSSTIRPRMDIIETPDKVSYLFDLPGIANKEDISLTVDNNVLRIDCEKPQVTSEIITVLIIIPCYYKYNKAKSEV